MLTLDEYKEELISKYRYEIDNSVAKKQGRLIYLEHRYSDEYLNKIIEDTYKVIRQILDMDSLKYGYCTIKMDDDTTSYISLDLTGGWFSDVLYEDAEGHIISNHILKKAFGKLLSVTVKENETLFSEEDDIISFNYSYDLYMQGFPKNIQSIKDNLFSENIVKKVKKYSK